MQYLWERAGTPSSCPRFFRGHGPLPQWIADGCFSLSP